MFEVLNENNDDFLLFVCAFVAITQCLRMIELYFTLVFLAFSFVKKLEPMNTLASSVWWVFGFYWIVVDGQALLEDSPRLYW